MSIAGTARPAQPATLISSDRLLAHGGTRGRPLQRALGADCTAKAIHLGEARCVGRDTEKPRVPCDAAHRPAVLIVHLSAQQPPTPRIEFSANDIAGVL